MVLSLFLSIFAEGIEVEFENPRISKVFAEKGWSFNLVGEKGEFLEGVKMIPSKSALDLKSSGIVVKKGFLLDGEGMVICGVGKNKKDALVVPYLVEVTLKLPKDVQGFHHVVIFTDDGSGVTDIVYFLKSKNVAYVRPGKNVCVMNNSKGEQIGLSTNIEIPKKEKVALGFGIAVLDEFLNKEE